MRDGSGLELALRGGVLETWLFSGGVACLARNCGGERPSTSGFCVFEPHGSGSAQGRGSLSRARCLRVAGGIQRREGRRYTSFAAQ